MNEFDWTGDHRFKQAITRDGFDLRVGVMLDGQSFGWLVYRFAHDDAGNLVRWRMVPPELQARVWATYKRGQCYTRSLVSREYLEAQKAAVRAVAEREHAERSRDPQRKLPL